MRSPYNDESGTPHHDRAPLRSTFPESTRGACTPVGNVSMTCDFTKRSCTAGSRPCARPPPLRCYAPVRPLCVEITPSTRTELRMPPPAPPPSPACASQTIDADCPLHARRQLFIRLRHAHASWPGIVLAFRYAYMYARCAREVTIRCF